VLDDAGRPLFNELLFGRRRPTHVAFDLLIADGGWIAHQSPWHRGTGGWRSGCVATCCARQQADRTRRIGVRMRFAIGCQRSIHTGFSDDGGLVSYCNNSLDQYRKAAEYVDRILRGEQPGNSRFSSRPSSSWS
jgi:hypothetical protein